MPERPPITAQGTIREVHTPQRLYEVELPNGYQALAVLPKNGPFPPGDPENQKVELSFSPYDMSRCKITRWL